MTTWRECAEAGMTLSEAARHLGRSRQSGSMYAKRHGFSFRRSWKPSEGRVENGRAFMARKNAVLDRLSAWERVDYEFLRQSYKYSRAEALVAIGRADLVQA